jgi:hypothetical protein
MNLKLIVEQALSAVALVNLAIQVLSHVAALQTFAEKYCSTMLPEHLATILKIANTDNGRLVLSAILVVSWCGAKMVRHPMREVRELGCTLLMLLAALTYTFLKVPQPHGGNATCAFEPHAISSDASFTAQPGAINR